MAHDNVRRMSTRQVMDFLKREVPAAPPGALPMLTFSDAMMRIVAQTPCRKSIGRASFPR